MIHGKRGGYIAAAVCSVALLPYLAGCGTDSSSSTPDGPVTITFESYNYGTPDLGGKGTAELIDAFQVANPNIKIKPIGVPVKDIYARVQAQAAAGDPPEVAQLGLSKMVAAVSALPVVPITDFVSPADFSKATAGIASPALAAGKVDGKQVAMPFTISTPTLFYNADLFKAAGLNPDQPPKTWADVKTAGLALRKSTDAQGFYSSIANTSKSDFLTQSIINSNGGALLDANGKPQLNTPAAVNALATMKDLTTSGAQPAISDDDAAGLFKSGKLGMYLTSTALLAGLEKAADGHFDLRSAALPAFGDLPTKPTYSGAGLFVLTKDAAKQKAAWKFIEYLTSAEGFKTVTEKIGYLPLRPAIVHDPKYLGPYIDKDPRILPALSQLDNVTPYQSLKGTHGDEARQILQDKAVGPIVFGSATPGSTCEDVNNQMNGLLD
ncbi:ABC transporter substrate-binding protein [Nocardia sp. NPDC058058]|uniref:ABC transporter substrate-binding protein n=1 Tax=Nocardia sp. NPDC058058 TaxID=3346317 RepID=UPI0036DD729B